MNDVTLRSDFFIGKERLKCREVLKILQINLMNG